MSISASIMSEHEKYLFLHGAMRGLKSRLESLVRLDDDPAITPVVVSVADIEDALHVVNTILDVVGAPP
jgi:hypothetical protein